MIADEGHNRPALPFSPPLKLFVGCLVSERSELLGLESRRQIVQNSLLPTPLLAAEGFLILRIHIQAGITA